jgi:hypothetical protein
LAPVRGFAKRFAWAVLVVVLLGTWAFGVANANAATRLKHDKANEVRFELDGRSLTATVVDLPRYQQLPTTLSRLAGKTVQAVCGTSFRRTPKTFALETAAWPSGVRSKTFTLSRDVSRRVKWCLLEQRGDSADVAFVSFVSAEPRRLLTRGRFSDGVSWRLFAWRGEMLEPCLSLRSREGASSICLADVAETGEGIEGFFIGERCSDPIFLLGAVSRSAVRVEARFDDGTTAQPDLLRRPPGSRVRAQYFLARIEGPSRLGTLIAYDRAGRVVARDYGINGMGGCPAEFGAR